MKLGFASRIAFMLAFVLVCGMGVTGILSIHKYERTLADLLTSRFEFVLEDVRHRIETQLDIGLSLDTVHITEELETFQRNDKQIISIEVFDGTGSVLFSTDPSFIGDIVSEEWVNLWRLGRGEAWSTLELHAGVVGLPLKNNLGQSVGSLALQYSRSFLDSSVFNQSSRLAIVGVIVAAVMAVLSFIGSMVLLRNSSHSLNSMSEAMDNVQNSGDEDISGGLQTAEQEQFPAFIKSAKTAYDEMDDITLKAQNLDEGAEI